MYYYIVIIIFSLCNVVGRLIIVVIYNIYKICNKYIPGKTSAVTADNLPTVLPDVCPYLMGLWWVVIEGVTFMEQYGESATHSHGIYGMIKHLHQFSHVLYWLFCKMYSVKSQYILFKSAREPGKTLLSTLSNLRYCCAFLDLCSMQQYYAPKRQHY